MWAIDVLQTSVHLFCTLVFTFVLLSLGITASVVVLLRQAESDTAVVVERIFHRG